MTLPERQLDSALSRLARAHRQAANVAAARAAHPSVIGTILQERAEQALTEAIQAVLFAYSDWQDWAVAVKAKAIARGEVSP